MVELADTLALEANAERRAGSSPAIPTNKKELNALFFFPYILFPPVSPILLSAVSGHIPQQDHTDHGKGHGHSKQDSPGTPKVSSAELKEILRFMHQRGNILLHPKFHAVKVYNTSQSLHRPPADGQIRDPFANSL